MLTSSMLILPRSDRGVALARTLWSADFVPALTIAAYIPHIPPGLNAATFKKVFMIEPVPISERTLSYLTQTIVVDYREQ